MFDADDGVGGALWMPEATPCTTLMGHPLPEFLHLRYELLGYDCDPGSRTIRIWTKPGAPVRYAATRYYDPMWGQLEPPIEEI